MSTPAKQPVESEAIQLLRAKLQGREERAKHLGTNHPTAEAAIAKVAKEISDLKKQIAELTK